MTLEVSRHLMTQSQLTVLLDRPQHCNIILASIQKATASNQKKPPSRLLCNFFLVVSCANTIVHFPGLCWMTCPPVKSMLRFAGLMATESTLSAWTSAVEAAGWATPGPKNGLPTTFTSVKQLVQRQGTSNK